jgi:subtilisin family serine protease
LFEQKTEFNSVYLNSGGGRVIVSGGILLKCKKALLKSLKILILSLFFIMIIPLVNNIYCNPIDQFYFKLNGDTTFLEEIENLHSIEVVGTFPDSIFNVHGIVYENIFHNTWSLSGNLDSIPQGFLDSFSVHPAYTYDFEYVDTLFILNQIVVYWDENVNSQQRSNFQSLYDLTYHDEIGRLTIFDVDDPFDKNSQVFQDPIVEYSIPRFLSAGSEPHNNPNDEFFTEQWYLHNTGQEVQGKQGFAGADINVIPAWEYVKGTGINVAVIDEGVPLHPDLPSSRQIRGEYSNVHNYIFGIGSTYDDPSPIGDEAHGTAVAGIIAAEMNNEEGIVGVAPESNIIPIKIIYGGWKPIDYYNYAIEFANFYEADIIVCAFGIFNEAMFYLTQLAMSDAVNDGIFIVCAAGNNADHEKWKSGRVSFPASYELPGIISVGASNREDKQANYSPNRVHDIPGPFFDEPEVFPRIDIVAPSHSFFRRFDPDRNHDEGGNIYTTDMIGSSGYNNVKPLHFYTGVPPEENPSEGTNYLSYTGRFGGTSAAAPQVAGVLALILDANPELTMTEVLDILYQTADKIGGYDYDYDVVNPGRSFETGYGRVNAGQAVYAALGLEFCGYGDDWVINSNELIENNYFSPGNVEISSGGELTIRSNVYLSDENSIIVKDGGKLILDGVDAIIDKCPESNHWQGIKVEAGGELLVNDGTILNAITSIDATGPSKVNIDGITIRGTGPSQGSGIKFSGNVEAHLLRKFDIRDCEFGIQIVASGENYYISTGDIYNVKTGIRLWGASGSVIGMEMESEVGVVLYKSPGSMVYGNRLQSSIVGISAFNSHNILISYNWIGYQTEIGERGINLVFNRGARVNYHPVIKARRMGIRSDLTDVVIKNNNIIVDGDNNNLGGIQLARGAYSYIFNNHLTINQSAFGIESNNNSNTIIKNNSINNFSTISTRTAAIRSMGTSREEIMDNLIEGVGNTTGILAQNSSYNKYECNEVDNTAEGLGIYHNSPIHLIRGNDFSASIDLSIRSMVGVHVRQGNKFIGGSTRAIGLDQDELDESKFYANSTIPYHMPTDPVPGNNEWFENDPNQNYWDFCDNSGPSWVPFDEDPNEICQFYQYLKSPDSLNPNKYFLGIYDLLYLSEMDENFTLPNCVLLDQDFQTLCGLGELVEVVIGLDSLSESLSGTDSLLSYQDQWVQETDSIAKEQLRGLIESEIDTLSPAYMTALLQDSLQLEAFLGQLDSIDCSLAIVSIWRNIYIQYINYLKNEGTVDSSDHSSLRQYSSLCSDIYGKPVHLARYLTASFDTTYYDNYDDCIYGMEQRIVRMKPEKDHKIEVYPNPTTGLLQIALPDGYNGELTVMDMSGKKVANYRIERSEKYSLRMPEQSGLFILEFISENGDMERHKVIVLE